MPRAKVFTVGLSAADRGFLVKLTTSGTHPARMIMRARVLLELDENAGPVADRAVIAGRVGTSENTVRAVAKRFADAGPPVHPLLSLDAAIVDGSRTATPSILVGAFGT